MPTSSITKNFIVSGKEQIEKFANAIEASANDTRPLKKMNATFLSDPKEIAEFMKNRKKDNSYSKNICKHF